VIPPVKVVLNLYNILFVLRIMLLQVLKDTHLYHALLLQFLLAPDHFECNEVFGFIIITFKHDSKRAFAQGPDDVVPVPNHIVDFVNKLPIGKTV
jgi:hypothetical protein